MRTQIVNFRADDALTAALAELARKDGVTISDVIRDAVRDRVAREIAPEPVPGPFNPFAHLKAAATGDIAAQRALADETVRLIAAGADVDPIVVLSEGLVFARLAAEHGDIGDHSRVIGMLALAADLSGGTDALLFRGEATARMAMLADQGVEEAELFLINSADNSSPEIMAAAQAYRSRMIEQTEAAQ